MKKIFLILLFCVFYTIEGQAQRILSELRRYDLKEVELRTIRKVKRKLRLPKELSVGTIHYFVVTFSEHMRKGNPCSSNELLKYLKLETNPIGFVYNRNNYVILAKTSYRGNVFKEYSPDYFKEYLYIKFFTEFKPQYIFLNLDSRTKNTMYLCYKDNEIFIVYLSDNNEKIICKPLSDIEDCDWLNASEGLFDKL
ncbi:hypothetical protein [Capnocytophaga endodontalis]|uniref:Uncharacterized protein n=1 Tax=Capnocytophaga endodontalis TaxID=2708117 RepID=A0A1Z4BMS5_9FLAO|nr:hypothetical protein [Capnocytophaga endodontalis]ASF42601.1 hypothetical protein CBG49_05695 [Capnocytophaga endodontalis]